MKKLHFFLWLALFLTASAVLADDTLTLVQGETRIIRLPFVLKSYRISPPDTKVIKVEEVDPNLSVTATAVGQVSLIVNGATGDQRIYPIIVKSELEKTKVEIERYLENVPELDISINESRIVIRGFVTNPDHWSQLQKVLSLYSNVVNFASFALSSDALMDLKTRLQNAGFVFAKDEENQKVDELCMTSTSDTIYISGELFSQASVDKLSATLAGVPILSSGLVKVTNTVTVAKTLLTVNIAFVSLSESNGFNKSGNLIPSGSFDMDLFRRWLDGSSRNRTFGIGMNMSGTLRMFEADLVSKVMEKGSLSFPNGGSATNSYDGSIKVPVSGIDSGDLKDVNFGYSVTISGGLNSAKEVELNLNLSQRDVATNENGDYVQTNNVVTMTVPLELNKTHIVSHHQKLTEAKSSTGLPGIKDWPVIGWIFGGHDEQKEVVTVLVMVNPTIQSITTDKKIDLDQEGMLNRMDQSAGEILEDSVSSRDSLGRILE